MKLIFAGTPEPAVVALEKLLESGHEIDAVITRPDARQGRGRTLKPSPVAALAAQRGIDILKPTTLKPGTDDGDMVRAELARRRPDCLPVVAYGHLITPDLLDIAPHGWVNLHFSLLPQWRGAAPVQAAIRAGDKTTGATTFRIAKGLDDGDILLSLTEEISASDTADDLLTRLAYRGSELLVETMDELVSGGITAQPQPEQGSYAPKLRTADARIDWHDDADVVERTIRAYTPAPGAWSMLGETRVKISPVELTELSTLKPGEMAADRTGVVVGTATNAVKLTTVKPEGKKNMAAADWVRGLGEQAQGVWQ